MAQRIGMAHAKSPTGPWARPDAPIIAPGPSGAWDDAFTADMAPYIFPNGSALIIYKAWQIVFCDSWLACALM